MMADALLDAMTIVSYLTSTEDGATRTEVHSLSYLACLVSVYDGKDASWWRYDFTSTEVGAPYAVALDDALDRAVITGAAHETDDLLRLSERGESQYDLLRNQRSLQARLRYLETACRATLVMPLPTLTEAVMREPQLRGAVNMRKTRRLLDSTGLDVLGPHFDGLRQVMSEVVGDESHDLLVPLTLWLAYLSSESAGELAA